MEVFLKETALFLENSNFGGRCIFYPKLKSPLQTSKESPGSLMTQVNEATPSHLDVRRPVIPD